MDKYTLVFNVIFFIREGRNYIADLSPYLIYIYFERPQFEFFKEHVIIHFFIYFIGRLQVMNLRQELVAGHHKGQSYTFDTFTPFITSVPPNNSKKVLVELAKVAI